LAALLVPKETFYGEKSLWKNDSVGAESIFPKRFLAPFYLLSSSNPRLP
jgi:hypothetical protein